MCLQSDEERCALKEEGDFCVKACFIVSVCVLIYVKFYFRIFSCTLGKKHCFYLDNK